MRIHLITKRCEALEIIDCGDSLDVFAFTSDIAKAESLRCKRVKLFLGKRVKRSAVRVFFRVRKCFRVILLQGRHGSKAIVFFAFVKHTCGSAAASSVRLTPTCCESPARSPLLCDGFTFA